MESLGRRRLVLLDHQVEKSLGLGPIGRVEHGPQVGAGLAGGESSRQMVEQILGQVELAALPRHAGEARRPRRFQAFVIVAGDQPHAVHPALLQRGQEFSPMDLRLRERDAHAQNRPPAAAAGMPGGRC